MELGWFSSNNTIAGFTKVSLKKPSNNINFEENENISHKTEKQDTLIEIHIQVLMIS